jgi:hypothetical protein
VIDLVEAVAQHLREAVPEFGGRVQDAAELAVLIERGILPQVTPAAFVLPLGEDAEPSAVATMFIRQRITEQVAVLLVFRHAGDVTGGRGRAGLEPLKGMTRNALVGWPPHPLLDPIEYRRGRLQGLRGGAVFYQMDFVTRWHLRREAQG